MRHHSDSFSGHDFFTLIQGAASRNGMEDIGMAAMSFADVIQKRQSVENARNQWKMSLVR